MHNKGAEGASIEDQLYLLLRVWYESRAHRPVWRHHQQMVAINAGATVDEGSTGNVVDNTMLLTTDVDNTAAQLVYTVKATTSNGTLRVGGTALGISDTFTQADIDAGQLTYDHDGSETVSDSFDFTVDDASGTSSSGTFNITVTPANDDGGPEQSDRDCSDKRRSAA